MAAIGIEIELLLGYRTPQTNQISGTSDYQELEKRFVDWFINVFNSSNTGQYGMHSDLDGDYEGPNEVEWSMTNDMSLEANKDVNQCE